MAIGQSGGSGRWADSCEYLAGSGVDLFGESVCIHGMSRMQKQNQPGVKGVMVSLNLDGMLDVLYG